jgi:hypothetical protein
MLKLFRRHLLCDLGPYNCIVDTCAFSSAPFGSRKLWNDHMIHQHPDLDMWTTFACPFCPKTMTGQQQALLSDIAKHLEEISLSALPQDVENDGSESERSTSFSDGTKPAANSSKKRSKFAVSARYEDCVT